MVEKRMTDIAVLLCMLVLFFTSCGPNTRSIKRMQEMEEDDKSFVLIGEIKGYLEKQMYTEAFEAATKGIEYYPANPALYYSAAVSAGYIANSKLGYDESGILSEKYEYLKIAEFAYLRAIELDPQYARALYALAVLYEYEFEQPAEAIPYLERFLTIEKKDTDGMFALARAYYMTYDFDKAVALYDTVLETPTSPEKKAEAAANKKIVLDASYGG
jgi:tetratricopeptide (TPR) repeat protein